MTVRGRGDYDLVGRVGNVAPINNLMQGKICLVTGGSDGIGYAVSRELSRMGARVIIVGRNSAKTEAAVERIIADTDNPEVEYLLADLSSQREVRRVAAEAIELAPHLDVLLNNAGAIFLSDRRSAEGMEMTFALNHLSYFLLTGLLLEHLRKAPRAGLSTYPPVHTNRRAGSGWKIYLSLPVMGDIQPTNAPSSATSCFTYELAATSRRREHHGQCPASRSGAYQHRPQQWAAGPCGQLLHRSSWHCPNKGAETPVYLATSPEVEGVDRQVFRGLPSSAV